MGTLITASIMIKLLLTSLSSPSLPLRLTHRSWPTLACPTLLPSQLPCPRCTQLALLLMPSHRLKLMLTMDTDTDTDTDITEATTEVTMVTPMHTTARGPLMPSLPSWVEAAECLLPPLLSSTTPLPSLPSPTPPTPLGMLSPMLVSTALSPSLLLLLLLLLRPWLLRGRRERLTPRSS